MLLDFRLCLFDLCPQLLQIGSQVFLHRLALVGQLEERSQVAEVAFQGLLSLPLPLQMLAVLEELLRRFRLAPEVGLVQLLV